MTLRVINPNNKPAGEEGHVQYNSNNEFTSDPNFSYINNYLYIPNIQTEEIAVSKFVDNNSINFLGTLAIQGVWNSTSVIDLINININNTASNSSSNIIKATLNNVNKFIITRDGETKSAISFVSPLFKAGLPPFFNSTTNTPFICEPSGTGGFQFQKNDNTATGGNARGVRAVDFQRSRTLATQVASGNDSVILSGNNNTANGSIRSVIVSGTNNTNSASNSIILSGNLNSITSSNFSTILGGNNTVISGSYTTAIGFKVRDFGRSNSFILGSSSNLDWLFNNTNVAQTTTQIFTGDTLDTTPYILVSNGFGGGA